MKPLERTSSSTKGINEEMRSSQKLSEFPMSVPKEVEPSEANAATRTGRLLRQEGQAGKGRRTWLRMECPFCWWLEAVGPVGSTGPGSLNAAGGGSVVQ